MDYFELPISKGMKTKIDFEDYERLKSQNLLKWNAQKSGKRFYVSRNVGKTKIYLHRYIMNTPKGMCIDHINRDPLDNRKENLRVCSYRQNSANKAGLHAFKGITKSKDMWAAQICGVVLGYFTTAADAARAYDIAASFVYKDFAHLNFEFSKKFKKLWEND